MEKRHGGRHPIDQAIVCTFFTSRSAEPPVGGRMRNYGDSGLYAELETCFKKGTVLLVRTTNRPAPGSPGEMAEGYRSISLAEVKWSRPLAAGGALCYATGLRHLSP